MYRIFITLLSLILFVGDVVAESRGTTGTDSDQNLPTPEVRFILNTVGQGSSKAQVCKTVAKNNVGSNAQLAALKKENDSYKRRHMIWSIYKGGVNSEDFAREALPDLLEQAFNRHEDLRIMARMVLEKLGNHAEKAVPDLLKALSEGSFRNRRFAAIALGKIGVHAKEAVPALIKVIQEEDNGEFLRTSAVEALGNMGIHAKEAVPALIKILQKDGNNYVLEAAVEALGKIGVHAKEAVPDLIKVLHEKKMSSAIVALRKIRGFSKEGLTNFAKLALQGNKQAIHSIVNLKEYDQATFRVINKALLGSDLKLKMQATEILSLMGSDASEGIPALVYFALRVRDRLPAMSFYSYKNKIADALLKLDKQTHEVEPLLIKALEEHYDPHVRLTAVSYLDRFVKHSDNVVPALIKALENDEDWGNRRYIATTLGDLGADAKEALPALRRMGKFPTHILHSDASKSASSAIIEINNALK
jgi:HEAT repeat protein